MSLGTWFRDYVYIPMGGNRVGILKWIRNIVVVWFLTGFWHGAQWNFILWGLYFALLLVLEKYLLKNILKKLPSLVGHIYVFFLIIISFVIFNSNTLGEIGVSLSGMFGLLDISLINPETIYYARSYGLVFALALIGATPIPALIINKISSRKSGYYLINLIKPLAILILLLIITGYLIDGSFNPFLYFRF